MLLIALAVAAAMPPQHENYISGGEQAWITSGISFKCADDHYGCAVTALHHNDVGGAVAELKLAAQQHDPRALRELGLMQLRGDILRRDNAAAVGWLYEAALVGDRQSMQLLAYAFSNGVGVAPDKGLAEYWRRRSLETR